MARYWSGDPMTLRFHIFMWLLLSGFLLSFFESIEALNAWDFHPVVLGVAAVMAAVGSTGVIRMWRHEAHRSWRAAARKNLRNGTRRYNSH
jgi:hypothetical protein